ncbi:thiosulfate oxidation carrier protein SoxY [Microbulbifer pacificus]|uniref:Thiosulfate oxidation carrier protein SoxY n=1 Tax=Microbulbifer pacificus TaxID=407164 RepID=A0AAU0MXG9_9GAMM|nr:thiosulfate oxidation carrier protein SoxY [Microbulbifer pacificus]WOX04742.1 thiosulfate oxidation carrier protein SoxY [Microbulbifer pacificus]
MKTSRRGFMKLAGAAVALGILPLKVLADFVRPKEAMAATDLAGVFASLGNAQDSDQIMLETPDIAENGAVVPITVTSVIPGTSKIYVVVEKNPNPLAAAFMIPEGTDAFVQTRVKVAQTCPIYAVVEAGGKLYKASRETKVTLGGCGG